MQLNIEKLVYGGDGLARLPADEQGPGKTVFLPFVLESELAEATLTEQKTGFTRARLEGVIKASPQRVEPGCPYFGRCGGCHYQHTTYAHQLETKASILRETLKRTARIDLPCDLEIHPSPEWQYRNRTRLKVQTEPEFAIGYYRFRSHDLLAVEQCPISSPLINRAISALWSAGRAGRVSSSLREIEFFADHADSSLLMEAYCDQRVSKADAQEIAGSLARVLEDVTGVVVFDQSPKQTYHSKPLAIAGEAQLVYQTKLGSYRVSAGSFFQVNRFLVDELMEVVVTGTSGQLALDLYAGVGLFSSALARSFAQVIAVEASQTSYSNLRQNVTQEVRAVRATTEQYLAQVSGVRPDLVIIDPPRGGLGENGVRNLAKLESPRVTYVSCDPSTLARDLRMLVSFGYQIQGAHLIDMFPQTYHLETIFRLAR